MNTMQLGLCDLFMNWLANAFPGDEFAYYEGPHLGGVHVAGLARKSFERGEVILFQRRSEPRGTFKYFARRRAKNA